MQLREEAIEIARALAANIKTSSVYLSIFKESKQSKTYLIFSVENNISDAEIVAISNAIRVNNNVEILNIAVDPGI